MTSDNKELLEIQAELQTLVMREAEAGKDEKKILVVRKRDLVSKIGLLERAVQEERVQKIKGPFNEPLANLPEPITPRDKKRLMKEAGDIAKARSGPKASPRRKREEAEDDEDDDLDGEERLRLGKKLKKSASIKATGKWGADIHRYMPESQIDTEEFNRLTNMDEDEKKANRMAITARLKDAAKKDRIKKRAEREQDDEDNLFV